MANAVSAALPQYWAVEGLRILFELSAAVGAVNRQFAPELAVAGNQVNAWRADKRQLRRKTGQDSYDHVDANLTPVPVVLDQYLYDSFVIRDEEEALTLPELTRVHLVPSIQALANGLERAILGRVHAFLRQGSPLKRAGKLQGMTKANASDYILEAEEVLAGNLAPMEGLRTAIVHHTVNTKLMSNDNFLRADARGGSNTVQTGEVGVVFNTRVVMSQNVNFVYAPNTDSEAKAVNNAAGYPAGEAGSMTVDGGATSFTLGEYVVFEENGQPTFATAATGATAVTLNEELKFAVTDNGVVTHYLAGANEAVARAAGYQKELTITHNTDKNLQVGQILSFGTGGSRHDYTVIEVTASTSTTTTVYLDRPLVSAVGSTEACFPGPAGAMCPVMHQDAIAFVSRPMRIPSGRDGANGAVANFNGLGLRVVTQYDSTLGGTRVNVDILAGVSVLDVDLLCVMCA